MYNKNCYKSIYPVLPTSLLCKLKFIIPMLDSAPLGVISKVRPTQSVLLLLGLKSNYYPMRRGWVSLV
jgi:hypothetical protein